VGTVDRGHQAPGSPLGHRAVGDSNYPPFGPSSKGGGSFSTSAPGERPLGQESAKAFGAAFA